MVRYYLFLLLLCAPFALFSAQEEKLLQRVNNHLVVKDYRSACRDAERGLNYFPDSKALYQLYIKCLARLPDEKELVKILDSYLSRFPQDDPDRPLLEEVAWGLIKAGEDSTSPIVRVTALLAAFYSQDVQGVEIVRKNLFDDNTLIRAISAQLASHLPDASLKFSVFQRFQEEKSFVVRLEVISALGKMKIVEAKPHLMKLIADPKSSMEEKSAATEALVAMLETIPRDEMVKLANSNRAGLRLLACEAVIALDLVRDLDLMVQLLEDTHAEVRGLAIQAIGALRADNYSGKTIVEKLEPLVHDLNKNVAAFAAWAITLNDPERGGELFNALMQSGSTKERIITAAALVRTGKYGVSTFKRFFQEEEDPLVRANLAVGLIGQQTEVPRACDLIFELLKRKERMMWKQCGVFRALVPSKVKHSAQIPQLPEMQDQLVRLELLNMLAIADYPCTELAVKDFLRKRAWGVSGTASALLLQEGDKSSFEVVELLLTDPDSEIRVQAALILALWGKGESAVTVLQEAYPRANRELKEKILEGLARVRAKSSIPFLVECLKEPYQTLRLISAAALLQCLSA